MTVDLEIGDRRYRASVAAAAGGRDAGSRLRVVLTPLDGDGDTIDRIVDVRATAHGYSLLEMPDGRVVDGAVTASGARDQWLVQLPGVDLDVVVNGRRRAPEGATGPDGRGQRVCAPMPGRVLRVLVESGTSVLAGQPLVVIEAMKMENALTALRDGVVCEVAVVEGVSVESGRLLLRIE
jgi:biotin carboxyl carrier protein